MSLGEIKTGWLTESTLVPDPKRSLEPFLIGVHENFNSWRILTTAGAWDGM